MGHARSQLASSVTAAAEQSRDGLRVLHRRLSVLSKLQRARARDDGRQLRLEAQRHLLARSLWPQVAGGASDLLRRRAQWAIDGGCAAPRTAAHNAPKRL